MSKSYTETSHCTIAKELKWLQCAVGATAFLNWVTQRGKTNKKKGGLFLWFICETFQAALKYSHYVTDTLVDVDCVGKE